MGKEEKSVRYNHMLKAKTTLYSLSKRFFAASDAARNDTYYFCVKETAKSYRMLAMVYRLGREWYIWYMSGSYRERIGSGKPLTYTLEKLEKEFQSCAA